MLAYRVGDSIADSGLAQTTVGSSRVAELWCGYQFVWRYSSVASAQAAYYSGYPEFVQLIYERMREDENKPAAARQSCSSVQVFPSNPAPSKSVDQKHHSDTRLRIAWEQGDLKTVEACLDTTRDEVNVPDSRGRTPLVSAAHKGHTSIIALLLQDGASIEVRGFTALRVACDLRQLDAARALLERGALLIRSATMARPP